ncbi:MAG: hypothetical protein LBH44_03030 [Treponema sp.]|nr:hypothetical protein [Treponema sp.]
MRKNKLNYRNCGKILSIVILLTFLKIPMYAEPLTEPPPNLTESGTKLWSDLEIDCPAELATLIEEISEAAYEASEQAASEAARAAMLASLDREVAALREAQRWRMEAENNYQEIQAVKQAGRKNTLLGVVLGILGGLVVGVGGTLIIGGR